ncbi:hypothetical protein WDV92_06505 [Pseudomonas syringae pv. atrofaciens]
MFFGDEEEIKISKDRRHLISSALAGSVEASKSSQHEFARLVSLKREAYGRSKLHSTENWRPSLTTGTLVKYVITPAQSDDAGGEIPKLFEYLICLTPACDTLRLDTETPFVFLRAQIENKKYGIVLKEQDTETLLRLDSKNLLLGHSFLPLMNLSNAYWLSQKGNRSSNFEILSRKNFTGSEKSGTPEQQARWQASSVTG